MYKMLIRIVLSVLLICVSNRGFAVEKEPIKLFPDVEKYVQQRIKEFDQIPDDRKAQLQKISSYVQRQIQAGKPIRLTFICTHNSRRSHLSQIWADTAARYYRISDVQTYSGGTEATAFNPRAVAALERAGLKLKKLDDGKNPHYAVRICESELPLDCFSKTYSEPPNPDKDFCAVMTCTQADQNCPLVKGCSSRISLPFEDPKVSDGTPDEGRVYDERCAQICRELFYVFSLIRE